MCAIATPFKAAGGLDMDAFGRLIDYQLEGGTQALVVAGSTGEAHFLEHDEYTRLLAFAVERVDGRVPVVAGTGEAGTAKTLAMTRHAASLGVDAALVVTPFYVRPPQDGLRRHFLEVADAADIPIVLYNVPSRTACDMAPATVDTLRAHPGIVGIKEAVADADRIQALAELAGENFVYLSGDDGSAGYAMLSGAAGTVSVVANLVPQHFRHLCDAARAGRHEAVQEHLDALRPLLDALACASNPISVKAGLAMLGFGDGSLRPPLYRLADEADLIPLRRALGELVPQQLAA